MEKFKFSQQYTQNLESLKAARIIIICENLDMSGSQQDGSSETSALTMDVLSSQVTQIMLQASQCSCADSADLLVYLKTDKM